MSSYVVKEREWDAESVRSGHGSKHYTTVRRYKVPERDDRTTVVEKVYDDDDARSVRTSRTSRTHRDEDREEIRIIRKETSRDERDDDRDNVVSYRVVDRERDRSRSSTPPRRREEKITIRRDVERSPSPEPERVREREYRFERGERDRGDRYLNRPYDLERYSKSTEFFSQPAPQPIIIRERAAQPIIIREEAPKQEVIIRREERAQSRASSSSSSSSPSRAPSRAGTLAVTERRSVVDEETAIIPAPLPPQEDYYYERVTREVDRPRRRRRRHHHRDEDKREREYNSDDDVKYVRREVHDYEVRDESPHTKRHLAEGAIAGLGAAALMRSRSKKRGENPGHRGRQALGYAAAGAIGVEALSRAKKAWDHSRSRSGEREVEEWYEDRDGNRRDLRHHRSKSRRRSRSRSSSSHHDHHKRNTVLAVAGIAAAAAAAYAAGKRGSNNNNANAIEDRRSRSRHRRGSASGASDRSLSRGGIEGTAQDPNHRNRRIAQVGLAGAALAGLAEHQRNKSRGRSRSKSRVRQAVPVVAAGLGTAAVAGLYEKFKANKERKQSQSRGRAASASRSRSRSRSRSAGTHDHRSRRAGTEAGLIEYGGDPIYTRDADNHQRSGSRGRSWSGSGSDRHRGQSKSRNRSRSRSRFRDVATGAAAAGVTGLALNEAKKRREAKKAEKERRRREEEATADGQDNYYDPMQYFPATNSFPPPPPGPSPYAQNPYQAPPPIAQYPEHGFQDPAAGVYQQPYNPADYPPQTGPTMPEQYYQQHRDVHSPTQDYYAAGQQQHPGNAPPPGTGHPAHGENPENVSALDDEPTLHSREVDDGLIDSDDLEDPRQAMPSGMSTPKSVKFDLSGPVGDRTKDGDGVGKDGGTSRTGKRDFAHSDGHDDHGHRDRQAGGDEEKEEQKHRARDSNRDRHRDRTKHDRRRAQSPAASDDSGATLEMPPRFDERGRRVDGGSDDDRSGMDDGALSKLFQNLVQGVFDSRGSRRR